MSVVLILIIIAVDVSEVDDAVVMMHDVPLTSNANSDCSTQPEMSLSSCTSEQQKVNFTVKDLNRSSLRSLCTRAGIRAVSVRRSGDLHFCSTSVSATSFCTVCNTLLACGCVLTDSKDAMNP